VRMSPRGVEMTPVRALPSVAFNSKENRVMRTRYDAFTKKKRRTNKWCAN